MQEHDSYAWYTNTILTVNEVEESLENSCKYGIPKKERTYSRDVCN